MFREIQLKKKKKILNMVLLSGSVWSQREGRWESFICMDVLEHCMLDRAHPRSHLAQFLVTLKSQHYYVAVILQYSAEEICCCCRQNTVLHFHRQGKKLF